MAIRFRIPENMTDHVDRYVGKLHRCKPWYPDYRRCYSDAQAATKVLIDNLSQAEIKKLGASIRSKRRNAKRQQVSDSLGVKSLSLKQSKIIQDLLQDVPEQSFGDFVEAYLKPLTQIDPSTREGHLNQLRGIAGKRPETQN